MIDLLIVDGHITLQPLYRLAFRDENLHLAIAASAKKAQQLLDRDLPKAIVIAADTSGVLEAAFLDHLADLPADTPRIVLSNYPDDETHAPLIRLATAHFTKCNTSIATLPAIIHSALNSTGND